MIHCRLSSRFPAMPVPWVRGFGTGADSFYPHIRCIRCIAFPCQSWLATEMQSDNLFRDFSDGKFTRESDLRSWFPTLPCGVFVPHIIVWGFCFSLCIPLPPSPPPPPPSPPPPQFISHTIHLTQLISHTTQLTQLIPHTTHLK